MAGRAPEELRLPEQDFYSSQEIKYEKVLSGSGKLTQGK